jgi:mono/diheme cytochrome c family protein
VSIKEINMRTRTLIPFAVLLLGGVSVTLKAQTVKQGTIMPTSPASGRQMFQEYCAVCHGRDGNGGGPAAAALKIPPADLTTLSQRNHGKFPGNKVFDTIKGDSDTPAHGSKEMPIWGDLFLSMSHGSPGEVQQRISNLTSYIATLQTKP